MSTVVPLQSEDGATVGFRLFTKGASEIVLRKYERSSGVARNVNWAEARLFPLLTLTFFRFLHLFPFFLSIFPFSPEK